MARKKVKRNTRVYVPGEFDQGVTKKDVISYTKDIVSLYGITTLVSRVFESIEDGLIPARRKILWYLHHDRNLNYKSPYVKVSEVIYPTSKYYAHGQMSLENTFQNMVQWWDSNADILDMSGITGYLTGDDASAPRYLECKMTKYAWKCFFEEFDESIVDMVRNHTDTDVEPLWLPSKYPNFLLSSNIGLGWGYAARYQAFNLIEAFELTKALVKNPDLTKVHLFPDSPRGYEVIDDGTAIDVCDSGYGKFPMRAPMTVELNESKNTYSIFVDGWPDGVFMDDVIKEIKKGIDNRKIFGIQDVADRSEKKNTVLEIQLKQNVNPETVMQELRRHTSLQTNGLMNYNFSLTTRKDLFSLKGAILYWINTRIDLKFRFLMQQLQNLQKKRSRLEAVLAIQTEEEFNKINSIVYHSATTDEAVRAIAENTGLNTFQAFVISDMKINQRVSLNRKQVQEEYDLIPDKIADIEYTLQSRGRIEDSICDELDEGIALFGKPRNCKIIKASSIKEVPIQYRFIITKKYIKKMSITGKNLVGTVDKSDDLIANFKEASENDKIIIISSNGKCYKVNPTSIKGCDAVHKGTSLIDAIGMAGDAVFAIQFTNNENEYESKELMLFTDNGIIKSSLVEQYRKCKNDSIGIILGEGDSVRYGLMYDPFTDAGKYMNIYTRMGMSVAWDLSQVTRTDRNTKGSNYFNLENDNILGICDVTDEIIVITRKGYMKICDYDDIFESDKRKPKFQRITKLSEGDELFQVVPLEFGMDKCSLNVYLSSGKKEVIAVKDIKKTTRISKGSKVIKLPNGDSIVKVKLVE